MARTASLPRPARRLLAAAILSAAVAGGVAPAAHAAPHGATYGGVTAQDSAPIAALTNPSGNTFRFSIYWEGRCTDQTAQALATVVAGFIGPDGRVRSSGSYDAGANTRVDYQVDLKFSSGTVTGSFAGTATVTGGTPRTCPSGTKTFTLRRAAFAAVFPPGPLVAFFTPSRKALASLTGWAVGTCSDGLGFSSAFGIRNLRVTRRTGRFSGSATQQSTTPKGNRLALHVTLSGRLSGRHATGKFKVTGRYTTPQGALIASCTTPKRSFTLDHT